MFYSPSVTFSVSLIFSLIFEEICVSFSAIVRRPSLKARIETPTYRPPTYLPPTYLPPTYLPPTYLPPTVVNRHYNDQLSRINRHNEGQQEMLYSRQDQFIQKNGNNDYDKYTKYSNTNSNNLTHKTVGTTVGKRESIKENNNNTETLASYKIERSLEFLDYLNTILERVKQPTHNSTNIHSNDANASFVIKKGSQPQSEQAQLQEQFLNHSSYIMYLSREMPNTKRDEILAFRNETSRPNENLLGPINFKKMDLNVHAVDPRIHAKRGFTIPPPVISSSKMLEYPYQTRSSNSVTVITCPHGWLPVGLHCITIAQINPVTQCPDYRTTFVSGPKSKMQVIAPGVCQILMKSGVELQCPKGFEEKKDSNNEFSEFDDGLVTTLSCSRTNFFIPINQLQETFCPLGYTATNNGCLASKQELSPNLICKEPSQISLVRVNEFSLKEKEYVECVEAATFKGRIICPEGFHPYNDPYPDFLFGDLIPANTPRTVWNELIDLGVLYDKSMELPDPMELLAKAEKEMEQKDTTTLCIKILAVFSKSCTKYKCSSPIITSASKIIRSWAYHRLYVDPLVAAKEGIPSGNDLRYTDPGNRKTHP